MDQANNEVQDVEFKDIQSPELKRGRTPVGYRILHVQVQGNPDVEALRSVAQTMKTALDKNSNEVVTTSDTISTFVMYEEGQPPFQGILVRGTTTVEDVARIAYCAQNADKTAPLWETMSKEEWDAQVAKVNAVLRYGPTVVPDELAFAAVAMAMVINLPSAPTTNLKPIQTWNGHTSIETDAAWSNGNFMSLQPQTVFRYADNPKQYMLAVSPVYVRYQGPYAYHTIDAAPVEVSGIKQIDKDDVTKGFELEWKIKGTLPEEQREQHKQEQKKEEVANEGYEGKVQHLSEEEAAPIREAAFFVAYQRGEIHLQGNDVGSEESTSDSEGETMASSDAAEPNVSPEADS